MSYVHVHRGSVSTGPVRVLPQPSPSAKLQPFSRQGSAPYSFTSERERSPRAVPRWSIASVYVQSNQLERVRRFSENKGVSYEWTPPATPANTAAQFFDNMQAELDCAPLPTKAAAYEAPPAPPLSSGSASPVKPDLLQELEAMQDAIDSLEFSPTATRHVDGTQSLPVSPVTVQRHSVVGAEWYSGRPAVAVVQSAKDEKLWRPW